LRSRTSIILSVFLVSVLALQGCQSKPPTPDLSEIYDEAAQNIGDDRNPVVVIPGLLGSKLEEMETMQPVWGAFTYGAADADKPQGARLIALPMEEGVSLHELRDSVHATTALDTLTLDIGLIRGLEISAYVDILRTLGVSGYADRTLGEAGAIDYGGSHYTCDQFAYDWRRDISEQAMELHGLILSMRELAKTERNMYHPPKVDVIAHSMGGLVLRYYLRYGPTPLPDDGSAPPLTWEGAEHVEHAILIGTPNAGSVLALRQLVEGVNYASLITPTYRPAVLGTMPAIYQLLPRPRHQHVVEEGTGRSVDFLDVETWKKHEWGLADPGQDRVLRWLLPEVESREERRRIALDHLEKTLARTRQLFDALDAVTTPPEGTRLFLVVGDALETPSTLVVDRETGEVRISGMAPGDDTVTRSSALMDEREGGIYVPRLQSPIDWTGIQFVSATHIGLTKDPAFTNFILYTLLEKPRFQEN